MKLNLVNQSSSNLFAFAAAAFVHISAAAWIMMPSDPVVINRQVIQVSFVAPNANNQKSENISQKKNFAKLEDKNSIKQKKADKEELVENKRKSAGGKETSGRVDPNAIATKAAETDPIFNAEYLNNPAPSYPLAAKSRNIQGKVFIDVIVKTDGTPLQVTISRSSGSKILDEAALDAVKQWRFIPARKGNQFVQAKVTIPVEFKII